MSHNIHNAEDISLVGIVQNRTGISVERCYQCGKCSADVRRLRKWVSRQVLFFVICKLGVQNPKRACSAVIVSGCVFPVKPVLHAVRWKSIFRNHWCSPCRISQTQTCQSKRKRYCIISHFVHRHDQAFWKNVGNGNGRRIQIAHRTFYAGYDCCARDVSQRQAFIVSRFP